MTKTPSDDPLLAYYTICWECASALGGVAPDYPVTCSEGKCDHCHEIKFCPAISDFDWPRLDRKRIWD